MIVLFLVMTFVFAWQVKENPDNLLMWALMGLNAGMVVSELWRML